MPSERDPNELGALWIKSSAKGEYMTGVIMGQPVIVFRNTRKSGKQPDWRVLKPQPKDERPTRPAPPQNDDTGYGDLP